MYKNKLSLITIFGFILGIIFGIYLPNFCTSISFIGDIYINLLKIMIIPILFFGIALAFTKDASSNFTFKTILLFVAMFLASYLIVFELSEVIKPGAAFSYTTIEWDGELANTSLKSFILNIFPSNILSAAANNTILPTILFAAVLGICIKKNNSEHLKILFEEINKVNQKILEYIMYLSPFGVFSLISNIVVTSEFNILYKSILYIGSAWLGSIIVLIIVMVLPVWIFAKINPITYIKNVCGIWATTISTCSSSATLPCTIKVCNKKFNIPEEITDVVVPLGCTIHMCGGAVSFALLATFNMQMYGMTWTPQMVIVALVSALLINMGAPGIPGGGIVIGATYLSILGIPLDFIGFYAGIYRFLDMVYTTLNVTGDISANILINEGRKYVT